MYCITGQRIRYISLRYSRKCSATLSGVASAQKVGDAFGRSDAPEGRFRLIFKYPNMLGEVEIEVLTIRCFGMNETWPTQNNISKLHSVFFRLLNRAKQMRWKNNEHKFCHRRHTRTCSFGGGVGHVRSSISWRCIFADHTNDLFWLYNIQTTVICKARPMSVPTMETADSPVQCNDVQHRKCTGERTGGCIPFLSGRSGRG